VVGMPTDHNIHPHLYDPSGVGFFALRARDV